MEEGDVDGTSICGHGRRTSASLFDDVVLGANHDSGSSVAIGHLGTVSSCPWDRRGRQPLTVDRHEREIRHAPSPSRAPAGAPAVNTSPVSAKRSVGRARPALASSEPEVAANRFSRSRWRASPGFLRDRIRPR